MRPGMRLEVMLILCVVCEKSSGVFPGFLWPGAAEGPRRYNGSLSPMDPVVCTDTYKDFQCTLDSEPEANRSLGFAIQTNMSGFFPVNMKDITVFNDYMIEYRHYFDPYVNTVKFKCFYWADDETWGQIDESLVVGPISFPEIYTKPEKVKDFNCVVENYVESMNCSWNYGIDYRENVKPTVLFEWRIPTLSGTWNPCPSLNINNGYCYWNSTRAGDFSLKVIDIRLTLRQECGMSVTSNFTIDTSDQVKPYPVESLSSAPVNSTCIIVTWNTTSRQYLKIHNVSATSKWKDLHEKEYTTNSATEKLPQTQMFCNLHEDTEYTFSVKVKPISKGYWSNIKTTVNRTFPDIPGASPEVGGYAWEPKDCREQKTRIVCVFWKSISKVDENGNMKGLDVFIKPVGGSGDSKHQSLSEDSTYNCQGELSCDQDYQFIIHARNDIGSSKIGSELTIIRTELGLEQPSFRVERDPNITSQVTVRWQYPQTLNSSYFTLVWCRKSGGTCLTNKLIQWKTVSANVTMFTWNLTYPEYPDDFMYGVSATTPQGQSGLHWESCIYTQNIPPSKAPQNVAVTVGAQDNTLVVTWNKLTCEPGQPYISRYNVEYCELDNMYCNNASVQATETLFVLKDLSEGVKHSVTVQGVTMNGLPGPWSDPAYGIPVHKSLKKGEIAGITVGAIVVLIVAVVVVFVIRRCTKRVSMKLKQAKDVKIPEDPGYDYLHNQESYKNTELRISTRSIERQDSGDSGYDPMTPPVDTVDKMEKLMVRPDGYAIATMQIGNCEIFNSSQSINSLHQSPFVVGMRGLTTQPGTTFPPVNNVVNTVHETGMKVPTEDETAKTFKPKTDSNNTSVKTANKTSNKDSGIGEGYSKATLSVSKEREDSVKSSNTNNTSVTEVNISPPIMHNNDLSSAPDYVTAGKHDSVMSESLQKISINSMLNDDDYVKTEAPSEGIEMSGICQLDTIPHPVMDSWGNDSICFEHNSDILNQLTTNETQDNNTLQTTDAYVSHGCSVDSNSLLDGTDTSAGVDSFLNSGPISSSSSKHSEPFSVPHLNSIPAPASIPFSQGSSKLSSDEDESTILYTSKDRPHVNSNSSGSLNLVQDANARGYVTAPNNPQASALSQISTNLVDNSSPPTLGYVTSETCQQAVRANPLPAEQGYVTSETWQQAVRANPLPAEQGYVTSETCQQAVRANPLPAVQGYVTSETCQQTVRANPLPAVQGYVTSETCQQAPVANPIPTNEEYVMSETCHQVLVANPQNPDDTGMLSSCSSNPGYVSHPPELVASFSGLPPSTNNTPNIITVRNPLPVSLAVQLVTGSPASSECVASCPGSSTCSVEYAGRKTKGYADETFVQSNEGASSTNMDKLSNQQAVGTITGTSDYVGETFAQKVISNNSSKNTHTPMHQQREWLSKSTSSYDNEIFAQTDHNSELNQYSGNKSACILPLLPGTGQLGSGGYVDETFAVSQNVSLTDNPISLEEQSRRDNVIPQPVEFGHSDETLALQNKNLNKTHADMQTSGPTRLPPQSNNGMGYVDQTFLTQQPLHVLPQSAITQKPPPIGPQLTVNDPKPSDGYVDESFMKLAQGKNGIVSKCPRGVNLSLQIGNGARQENEGEERSEKDSDSGLSSLEQSSPETEEKQHDIFVQK